MGTGEGTVSCSWWVAFWVRGDAGFPCNPELGVVWSDETAFERDLGVDSVAFVGWDREDHQAVCVFHLPAAIEEDVHCGAVQLDDVGAGQFSGKVVPVPC